MILDNEELHCSFVIPFLKDGAALQVFVKCNLIRHKLEVYATNKEIFSIRNGITLMLKFIKPYMMCQRKHG